MLNQGVAGVASDGPATTDKEAGAGERSKYEQRLRISVHVHDEVVPNCCRGPTRGRADRISSIAGVFAELVLLRCVESTESAQLILHSSRTFSHPAHPKNHSR